MVDLYQVHHLIPEEIFEHSTFLRNLSQSGIYSQNSRLNLLLNSGDTIRNSSRHSVCERPLLPIAQSVPGTY